MQLNVVCALVGACISLKEPALAVAVECCLRSFMKAFCCDNYKDEAVLQRLMGHFYPKGNRPQIIVCSFSNKLYDVCGRSVAVGSLCVRLLLQRFLFSHPSPILMKRPKSNQQKNMSKHKNGSTFIRFTVIFGL